MDWKRCAAMGLLLLAPGCGGDKGKKVSQAEYGQSWPLMGLIVESLSCLENLIQGSPISQPWA